jgi:hypothetical protein
MPVAFRTDLEPRALCTRDDATALGYRLKDRVYVTILPCIAQGFLVDRQQRLGTKQQPTDEELREVYDATLTLLFRLLFLLYAEARHLLPVRDAGYRAASLWKIKEEIASRAGITEREVDERISNAYSANQYGLYDRLTRLCVALAKGEPGLNVPMYDGGLFTSTPRRIGKARGEIANADGRDQRSADVLTSHKVPDRFLALAIDRLARDVDDSTLSLVALDFASLEVRHLGSIYEGLLEFELKVADEDLTTKTERNREKYIPLGKAKSKRGKAPVAVVRTGQVYLWNNKLERKSSGSYYTPDPIVKYMVEHTVGPVLEAKLARLRSEFRKARTSHDHEALVDELFDFRVLDPAMGSGHFLVDAVDHITDRMLAFLNEFPVNPVGSMLDRIRQEILDACAQQGISVDTDKLTATNLLKRQVLKQCIYGVDLNPMAVELTKASLWLDALTIGAPLSFLDDHLCCGNSLIGTSLNERERAANGSSYAIEDKLLLPSIRRVVQQSAGFDAVVGNPPYAGHKGDFDAQPLRLFYEVCRDYANPATAFLQLGFKVLRHDGRLGMIIPKSIQYVEAWTAARRLLAELHQLTCLVDVSQAFDGVLLEQTVCFAASRPGGDGYFAGTLSRNGAFTGTRIERPVAQSLGCLPARVNRGSLPLLQRMMGVGPRLDEISYTSQALGYQAHVNRDVTGEHFPIYRGKQIRPMRIDLPTDFIDRSFLISNEAGKLAVKVLQMLRPKVVSQNIVAHVTRPRPRSWVISAPDHNGIICLNTVSTTILHDERFPIDFIAAVLNSTLASWYYTEFVFCRAIRTMHFDNYYAGKLPIARISPADWRAFEQLTESVDSNKSRGARQRAIDEIVFAAYGLSAPERSFLYEYCYGTEDLEAVLSGF